MGYICICETGQLRKGFDSQQGRDSLFSVPRPAPGQVSWALSLRVKQPAVKLITPLSDAYVNINLFCYIFVAWCLSTGIFLPPVVHNSAETVKVLLTAVVTWYLPDTSCVVVLMSSLTFKRITYW